MKKAIFFLSIVLAGFTSCKKPVACMSPGKDIYYAGDPIHLNSYCSENVGYVKWIMPGGIEIANEVFYLVTDETWANYQFVVSLEVYSKNGKRMDRITREFKLEPVYGEAVFYANENSSDCGDINVVYGESSGTITKKVNFMPDCDETGCAVLKVKCGYYDYYASDGCKNWGGTLYVGKDDCKKVFLD